MTEKIIRKVVLRNLQKKVKFDESLVRRAVGIVLKEHGLIGEINVVFAGDCFLRELNLKYLSKNSSTDVLAFEMGSDGVIGDVVVSADMAESQAAEYKHSVDREAALLAVHGALHLAGFDDRRPAEKKNMEKMQYEILEKAIK